MVSMVQRCVGAVVGSLVADAAAVPIHWVYNREKLDVILQENPVPEFIQKSYCPFYTVATGKNSCYGDQTFVLLQSIAEMKGFDKQDYIKRTYDTFGKHSDYEIDLGHPITRDDYPIIGPWRNGSIKDFLQNYEAGQGQTGSVKDSQSDSFTKVAPLVVLSGGNTNNLISYMESAIRVTQENDLAIKCGLVASRILEQYIMGKSIDEGLEKVYQECDDDIKGYIQRAKDNKDKSHLEFVKEVGSSCALPGNFINSIHCLLKSDGDFRNTVVDTIIAGGCNCSRACFVGACMGAVCGIDAVPKTWIEKTLRGTQIVELANTISLLRNK